VQLNDVVLAHAARVWPPLPVLKQAQRVKFRRPIRPGQQLCLTLARTAQPAVLNFEISVGQAVCSSGALEFAEALP